MIALLVITISICGIIFLFDILGLVFGKRDEKVMIFFHLPALVIAMVTCSIAIGMISN